MTIDLVVVLLAFGIAVLWAEIEDRRERDDDPTSWGVQSFRNRKRHS